MVVFFLSVLFSIVSTGMMSYLTMNTQVGPWVAPVFSVVCMTFIMPLFSTDWLRKYAVVIICAGSIGGMIGTCLGLSFPSFYFMYPKVFESWVAIPYIYVSVIGSFVAIAAVYALLLSYVMRRHYVDKVSYDFPMSQLVHDVIVVRQQQDSRILMFFGIALSTLFNAFVMFGRFALQAYTVQIHMAPLLVSLGFVIGKQVAYPILLGLFTRVVSLHIIHQYVPVVSTDKAFLVTFCSGMLLFWFVQVAWAHLVDLAFKKRVRAFWGDSIPWQRWFFLLCGCVALLLSAFFSVWHISYLQQLYVVMILFLLAMYMVNMVATVGIIEIDSYVWFMLLPLVYSFAPVSLSTVAIAVFAMICLGLVVDCIFSYKLAALARVPYSTIVRYQVIALCASLIASGLFFVWYVKIWGLGSLVLMSPKAHELDNIMRFGHYNYKALLFGFGYGFAMQWFTSELLVVIGAVLMMPFMSTCLVVAGALAHLIRYRERLYPLCFGVYAGYMAWLILQAIM